VASSVEQELRAGSLAVIDVAALQGVMPVTLVRRHTGWLGGAAKALAEALGAPKPA
jgi:hypothetical protein